MKIRSTLLASALALVAGISFQASAAETSSTFKVTATVASSCAILGAGNLNFGSYDPAVANASAYLLGSSSGIDVRCNGGTTASVQLDEGLNKDGGSTCASPVRVMVDGSGNRLAYSLARTSDLGTPIGCDASTEATLTFASLETQNVPVYGSIAPSQNVPVGSYEDTVTVKVTF